MGWSEFQDNTFIAVHAIAETQRFNFEVQNLTFGRKFDAELTTEELEGHADSSDLTVLKYPSNLVQVSAALSMFGGQAIVADPTVYWISPVLQSRSSNQFEQNSEYKVSACNASEVREAIYSAFDGYQSHWHFNSRTSHLKMPDAYFEWVSNGMYSEGVELFCLRIENREAGMAMIKTAGGVVEVLLAGIHRDFQGQGHYASLLSHIEQHAIVNECNYVVISTQSQNTNVQRAWSRIGWQPELTIHCVHLEKR